MIFNLNKAYMNFYVLYNKSENIFLLLLYNQFKKYIE